MGLFDALTAAVSGLQSQAFAMQNISGNIANSQTIAYKGINTSFEDLIPGVTVASQQVAGGVIASSVSTNTLQGQIQSATSSTDMAINGDGYFVVQAPTGFSGNTPLFGGVDSYTRRGDFQLNSQGYLVNGAGYYLEGLPIDPYDRQSDRHRCQRRCNSRITSCRPIRPRKSPTASTSGDAADVRLRLHCAQFRIAQSGGFHAPATIRPPPAPASSSAPTPRLSSTSRSTAAR